MNAETDTVTGDEDGKTQKPQPGSRKVKKATEKVPRTKPASAAPPAPAPEPTNSGPVRPADEQGRRWTS